MYDVTTKQFFCSCALLSAPASCFFKSAQDT
jgi:hypothetical protein